MGLDVSVVSDKTSDLYVKKSPNSPNKCLASTAEILRRKQKQKVDDLSTITLGYIKSKMPDKLGENQRLRVLFDSGCSATLLNKRFVRNWHKTAQKSTKWSTKAGSFKTKHRCEVEFTLPAFHENRTITCNVYVDESHQAAMI